MMSLLSKFLIVIYYLLFNCSAFRIYKARLIPLKSHVNSLSSLNSFKNSFYFSDLSLDGDISKDIDPLKAGMSPEDISKSYPYIILIY